MSFTSAVEPMSTGRASVPARTSCEPLIAVPPLLSAGAHPLEP